MSARIVSFVSAKGGSGKTVTSSALGTFLAALGFKTLLIDTDAATNGMTLLYLEQLLGPGQKEALTSGSNRGLFETPSGELPTEIEVGENLWLIPATFRMSDTESVTHNHLSESLDRVLTANSDFDFILLDAQAGIDGFAKTAARAAETDIIVSEYDPVSAQGIERLKVFFSDVMSPSSTWTLFNKVLPEFASVIGEGLSIARFLPPVPWDADVVRAFARRDLAINFDLPNPYTLAIAELAYRLFPEEAGDAIEKWRGGAFKSATSPVEQRLKELDLVERELKRGDYFRSFLILIILIITGAMLATGFVTSVFALLVGGGVRIFTDRPLIDVATLFMVISGFASALAFSPLSRRRLGSIFGVRKDALTLKSVAGEREKLLTSLEAARSTFRANEKAGIYEQRRRKRPLQPY